MTMTDRYAALAAFVRRHALREGDFVLASGERSRFYVDGKQVTFHPEGLGQAVELLEEAIAEHEVTAVGGMEMGATPLAAALALASHRRGRPWLAFTVRKTAKDHGTEQRVEGHLPAGAEVAVLDDVVTTGGSLLQAVDAVEAAGGRVAVALALLDRESGARERLRDRGIPYKPLLGITDL